MTDLAQTAPLHMKSSTSQATLCIAYGVYGRKDISTVAYTSTNLAVPKETSGWQRAPALATGTVEFTSPNAVKIKFKPDILGSSPKHAEATDPGSTKLLHAAMRASYPNDVEVCFGDAQPPCVNHSFVLQQSSTSTIYGVSLLVWSKADEKRCKTIYELRLRDEAGPINADDVYWIPYSLCFLSPYPLFNLLSDYLKGMWIHWSKSTNLFHAEEVSRILSFPAPRLQDLVRIDMKDYALAYQFPSHPSGFQNFPMWPLFSCLSVPNIVSVIETALSPSGRIIFTSKHPAILNIASESTRLACRIFEWSGLYVPVAHCSAIKSLVEEKGPYILGITSECRRLISAPADVVVVDLDQGLIQTRNPPIVFLKSSSREKFVNQLKRAIDEVDQPGVPQHLKEAYTGGQLTPEGQVICIKGRIDVIEDPLWWKQESVLAACDHVCRKLAKNKGVKALTSGSSRKKPLTTKISIRALQEIEREKSSNAREIQEAWLSYCLLKTKMGTEVSKLTKRNEFLLDELNTWKAQFEKFQLVAQDLTKQSLELKRKIDNYKAENRQLNVLIKERALEHAQVKKERDMISQENSDLIKEKQHLKEKLRVSKKQNEVLSNQREEVEGVLRSLRQLIETQPAALEDIIEREPAHLEPVSEDTLFETTSKHSAPVAGETRSVHTQETCDVAGRVVQIETASEFERTLNMEKRLSQQTKRTSISDVADAVVREKTREITNLVNRITADCIAAIDRINVNDDVEDSPFDSDHRRSLMMAGDLHGSTSSASLKRQSDMTTASEAIAELDFPIAPVKEKRSVVKLDTKTKVLPFTQAMVQEIHI